jgi:hypothetical protein
MLENAERSDSALGNPLVSYRNRLQCWAIVRLLPNMQRVVINRFRCRADADGHLQFLQRQIPAAEFELMFDTTVGEVELPQW